MSAIDHPFIIKLKGLAQDKRMVYLYLEHVEGGDLMGVLNRFKKLEPEFASFYVG